MSSLRCAPRRGSLHSSSCGRVLNGSVFAFLRSALVLRGTIVVVCWGAGGRAGWMKSGIGCGFLEGLGSVTRSMLT